MSDRLRILIAGGGIAGLSLATGLRRLGFETDLVERSPRWHAVGGGIAVQPNAMRVLHRLGVGDAVERAGANIRRFQYCDQQGDVLCDVDLTALWGEVGPFVGIERIRLQEALKSAAGACRLGAWVASLSQDDRGVSIAFNDGSVRAYDLVVGADGIHSAMRQFVTSAPEPAYGGQMVWRSVAPVRLPAHDAIQFWLGDGCFFGLCPVAGGTYGFANVTQPRMHDTVEGRLERMRHRFAAFGGLIRDYMAALDSDDQIHYGPIEWLEIEPWHRGRVILIGDAAHASSPMMGQGGSMAMEDASVLAEILQGTCDIKTAIESFVTRRKPRADWVHQQSRAAGETLRMSPDTRNAALRANGVKVFRMRFQPLTAMP